MESLSSISCHESTEFDFFFFFILMYASLKQYILKQTATSKNCLGYIERLKGF